MRGIQINCFSWIIVLTACGLATTACNQKKVSPAAARQTRLDWNIKTLVGAYQDIGSTDAKWDTFATNALLAFAHTRSQTYAPEDHWSNVLQTNCEAAIAAGCDDPLMGYLRIRFCMSQTNPPQAFADALCKVANDMQQVSYPKIRQFYAALRAAEQMKKAAGGSAQPPREVHGYRQLAISRLAEALADKSIPIDEADDACHELFEVLARNPSEYELGYSRVQDTLRKKWPDESFVWLLNGEVYFKRAWFARGTGYADQVPADAWKLFSKNLEMAEASLQKAWKLNPHDDRIPAQMISVTEGLEKDRAEMELWFSRAMTINPNCYQACEHKLHYLYPQWYGSREAMIEFGRQCVASTNWGGSVPLILADAHREFWQFIKDPEAGENYWKLPEVWPDINASFARFFELNPDATGYYHNYAWYAYHAEQWDKLNELIPKLGAVNYAYFGGETEFNKMVQLAKEHARNSKIEAGK